MIAKIKFIIFMRFQCVRGGGVLVMVRCCRGARLDLRCKFALCSAAVAHEKRPICHQYFSSTFFRNSFSDFYPPSVRRALRWCAALRRAARSGRTHEPQRSLCVRSAFLRSFLFIRYIIWLMNFKVLILVCESDYVALFTYSMRKKIVCFALRRFFFSSILFLCNREYANAAQLQMN